MIRTKHQLRTILNSDILNHTKTVDCSTTLYIGMNIHTVGQLVKKPLREYKNDEMCTKENLKEIRNIARKLGLYFDMDSEIKLQEYRKKMKRKTLYRAD